MSATAGATAAGGAAAAAAAIAQATKDSGVIVRLESREFTKILHRLEAPLVVVARGGFLTKHHQYLLSYKGLAFFTKSEVALDLPSQCEVVQARKIWIP